MVVILFSTIKKVHIYTLCLDQTSSTGQASSPDKTEEKSKTSVELKCPKVYFEKDSEGRETEYGNEGNSFSSIENLH